MKRMCSLIGVWALLNVWVLGVMIPVDEANALPNSQVVGIWRVTINPGDSAFSLHTYQSFTPDRTTLIRNSRLDDSVAFGIWREIDALGMYTTTYEGFAYDLANGPATNRFQVTCTIQVIANSMTGTCTNTLLDLDGTPQLPPLNEGIPLEGTRMIIAPPPPGTAE